MAKKKSSKKKTSKKIAKKAGKKRGSKKLAKKTGRRKLTVAAVVNSELSYEQLAEAIDAKRQEAIAKIDRQIAELQAKRAALAGGRTARARMTKAATKKAGGKRGPRGSMKPAILNALAAAGGPMSPRDLASSPEVAKATTSTNPNVVVSQALASLVEAGSVSIEGRGAYKLTASGRKEAVPI